MRQDDTPRTPEPNTTILGRIRDHHPGCQVTRTEDGAWQALLRPTPTSEEVHIRRRLADLEQFLDERPDPEAATGTAAFIA